MKFIFKTSSLIISVAVILSQSCTYEKAPIPKAETNYPEAVEAIIINKCATAGCHNEQSKAGAGGLNLETFEKLFEGGNGGAVVIPYRDDFSTMLYYTNTDSSKGLVLTPTMPVNGSPLSAAEYETLRSWIANGAPDKNGFVKFSDNPSRKKYYVTNQGCRVVSVFDAKTNLVMRMRDVGTGSINESPHCVRVSPDNKFWCVSFLGGAMFQKYSTIDNSLLGEVNIGVGSWNTFVISNDSKKAYTVDFGLGVYVIINLETMTKQSFTGILSSPHGTSLNETSDTLYSTGQSSPQIWKFKVNNPLDTIAIKFASANIYNFHEIVFSNDGTKYFLTEDKASHVFVVDRHTDTLIVPIPVGFKPQEMAISKTLPYLFVTCMEDQTTFPGKMGSVYVINTNTHAVIKTIYTGHQPHGIAVDDANGKVYVTNRNATAGGPPPHHSSVCGGKNGTVAIIDLNTLELISGADTEVSVDPYGMGITH
jgi:YVTN family beta-propeller protein